MRILTVVFLLVLCSGCGKTVYVPVETIRTETRLRDRFLRDSVYLHDSVHIRERGDTVVMEKWHTRYRDRLLLDTCYVHKTDSVAVPYPVEKKLSKWSRFKMDYFSLIMIGVAAVAFLCAMLLSKRIK